MKRPIFYDTETTGLRPTEDRIIEIAAYDPVRNASFCYLIDPQIKIPADASRIHGITDDMVQGSPFFAEVGQKFALFCEGDVVLVAHNNDQFDKHFLEAEAKRCGLTFPQWAMVDSLKWARKYRPDLPRHSLQFLREIYEIPPNTAHRALDDVMILYQVFSAMIDDLSMETVLELLEPKENIDKMPFGKHQGKPLNTVPKEYLSWLAKQGAFEKPENSALKMAFEKLGKL
jgi:DNA polymerase-3 subunit epsilon